MHIVFHIIYASLLFGVVCADEVVQPADTQIEEVEEGSSQKPNEHLDHTWQLYKIKFDKYYENRTEEMQRRVIWESNLHKIGDHNMDHDLGNATYRMGVNQFTDWSDDEYNSLLTWTMPAGDNADVNEFDDSENVKFKKVFNYVRKGKVSSVAKWSVEDTSWLLASVGVVEAQLAISEGKFEPLAKESIANCLNAQRSGSAELVFQTIRENGIATNETYSNLKDHQECQLSQESKMAHHIESIFKVKQGSERALRKALTKNGPLVVAVDASSVEFRNYKSGILNFEGCSMDANELNHSLLVVGYGVHENKIYWIAKNFWGKGWGENGYVFLSRGKNLCGIASHAVGITLKRSVP